MGSLRLILIGVCLILLAIIIFVALGESEGEQSGESAMPESGITAGDANTFPTEATISDLASSFPAWEEVDPLALDELGPAHAIESFTLVPDTNAPQIMPEHLQAIEAALEPYEESDIAASFLLMDIGTGRGIACNMDESIYGASSFKGPYSAFVCEEYLEEGKLDFSTEVMCDPTSCPSGTSSDGTDSIYHLMESAIINSSNEAYQGLRDACTRDALASWLTSVGVDPGKAYGTRLPFFTVRDMAKMWLDVHAYLQTDSQNAETLADLYSKTDLSFIRDALAESVDGDVLVMDKGGWFRPDDEEQNSVVDCGIVQCDGRDYLLCVMTGARWTEQNVNRIETLISAVFSARDSLL